MTLSHSIIEKDGNIRGLDTKELMDYWECHETEYFKGMGMKIVKSREELSGGEANQGRAPL